MISSLRFGDTENLNGMVGIFTARKRSLGQDNMFTGVCLSTGGGGGVWSWGCLLQGALVQGVGVPGPDWGCLVRGGSGWEGVPAPGVWPAPGGVWSEGLPGGDPPPGRLLLRALCILLECILVFYEELWDLII